MICEFRAFVETTNLQIYWRKLRTKDEMSLSSSYFPEEYRSSVRPFLAYRIHLSCINPSDHGQCPISWFESSFLICCGDEGGRAYKPYGDNLFPLQYQSLSPNERILRNPIWIGLDWDVCLNVYASHSTVNLSCFCFNSEIMLNKIQSNTELIWPIKQDKFEPTVFNTAVIFYHFFLSIFFHSKRSIRFRAFFSTPFWSNKTISNEV